MNLDALAAHHEDYEIRRDYSEARRELHTGISCHIKEGIRDYIELSTPLTGLHVEWDYVDFQGRKRDLDIYGTLLDAHFAIEIKTGGNGSLKSQREAFYRSFQQPSYFFLGQYTRDTQNLRLKFRRPVEVDLAQWPFQSGFFPRRKVTLPDPIISPLESKIEEVYERVRAEAEKEEDEKVSSVEEKSSGKAA